MKLKDLPYDPRDVVVAYAGDVHLKSGLVLHRLYQQTATGWMRIDGSAAPETISLLATQKRLGVADPVVYTRNGKIIEDI